MKCSFYGRDEQIADLCRPAWMENHFDRFFGIMLHMEIVPLKIKDLPIEARPREAFMRSVGIDESKECAYALYLDAKRHLLCEPMVVSRGTADKTFLHPREIFRHAIRLGAVSVIVAHNHPSGDPSPSEEDIEETKRLRETGEIVGIPLDDHVVIGSDGSHVSIMQLMRGNLV